VPCVWLAVDVDEMPAVGNGTGESFRIYRSGRVKVITDRRAYQLLHGMPNHDRVAVQSTGGGLHRCITEAKASEVPLYTTKVVAERYLNTNGVTVLHDLLFKVRHYRFCGYTSGYVATLYTWSKTRGWVLDSALLMYACKDMTISGQWVACPFNQVNDMELGLLKPGTVQSRRLP
jgi:hypothetical protein